MTSRRVTVSTPHVDTMRWTESAPGGMTSALVMEVQWCPDAPLSEVLRRIDEGHQRARDLVAAEFAKDAGIDMTGHDEALRGLLHKHATFLTAAGQAIEAALAGETVEWPEQVPYASERAFLTRYYPGAHSIYLPIYLPEVGVTFPGGRKKTIWSAS